MKKALIFIVFILSVADGYSNNLLSGNDRAYTKSHHPIRGRHRGIRNALKSRRQLKRHDTIKTRVGGTSQSRNIIKDVFNALDLYILRHM